MLPGDGAGVDAAGCCKGVADAVEDGAALRCAGCKATGDDGVDIMSAVVRSAGRNRVGGHELAGAGVDARGGPDVAVGDCICVGICQSPDGQQQVFKAFGAAPGIVAVEQVQQAAGALAVWVGKPLPGGGRNRAGSFAGQPACRIDALVGCAQAAGEALDECGGNKRGSV